MPLNRTGTRVPPAETAADAAAGSRSRVCGVTAGRSRFVPDAPPLASRVTSPLAVWLLDEPECAPYARYLEHHPDATLFHTLAWRDALFAAGAGRPFYLAAMDSEHVVGVLPLFETENPSGARSLVSLPLSPAAGVLTDDGSAHWLLQSRALQLAESRGVAQVIVHEFRSRPADGWLAGPPKWARIRIDSLLSPDQGYMPPTAGETSAENVAWSPEIADVLKRNAPRGAGVDGSSVLSHFAESSGKLRCAVERRPDGRIAAAAAWTTCGTHAHVLACGPAYAPAPTRRRLFLHIASLAREEDADTLDFPFPISPDFWFLRLLTENGLEIADTRRIVAEQVASI